MKRLHRLIMAGTVLSGAALASMAQAEIEGVTIGPRTAPMKLAQAPEPEKKPQGAPGQKPPAKRPPAAPPHAAPPQRAAPPPQRPAQPAQPPMQRAQPPAAQPRTPPPPPAVQRAPQPAPQTTQPAPQRGLQRAPQTTQPAPQPGIQRAPQTTQPAPQTAPRNGYVRPLAPQATPPQTPPQTTPPTVQGQPQRTPQTTTPPAAQGQQPSRTPSTATPPTAQQPGTTTPPAAQGQQPARTPQTTTPPAAQGQQPAHPAQPATPPAAAAPTPAPAPANAGAVPNTQTAPLLRSGAPALTQQYARPIPRTAPGAGLAPQTAQGQFLRRMPDLRAERHETVEGNRTIIREPDRTIIRDGGRTFIRHNDTDRFRVGARDVRIEQRGNNNNVTIIDRPGGDRIVTVLDDDGYLRRRSRIMPDGREIVIIDNRAPVVAAAGGYANFFVDLPPPVIRIPRDRYIVDDTAATPELIYDTLEAPPVDVIERPYSLDEIRYSAPLRDRMPRIDLSTITFDSASWDIPPEQMQTLAVIADGLNRAIARNPREVFMIEGHTDATGNDVDNLSLSDRRAESVAIALSEQFNVPAENLVTQGYGEQFLKVPTEGPERANRRVTVRRITPLLAGR